MNAQCTSMNKVSNFHNTAISTREHSTYTNQSLCILATVHSSTMDQCPFSSPSSTGAMQEDSPWVQMKSPLMAQGYTLW